MGKGTFIATVALLVAVAGAIVAFAAYFKRRNYTLCDDLDDMMDGDASDLDYYATQLEDEEEDEEEEEPDTQDGVSSSSVSAERDAGEKDV